MSRKKSEKSEKNRASARKSFFPNKGDWPTTRLRTTKARTEHRTAGEPPCLNEIRKLSLDAE